MITSVKKNTYKNYDSIHENFTFWSKKQTNRLHVSLKQKREFLKYIDSTIESKWTILGSYLYFDLETDRDMIYVSYSMGGLDNLVKSMKVYVNEPN